MGAGWGEENPVTTKERVVTVGPSGRGEIVGVVLHLYYHVALRHYWQKYDSNGSR